MVFKGYKVEMAWIEWCSIHFLTASVSPSTCPPATRGRIADSVGDGHGANVPRGLRHHHLGLTQTLAAFALLAMVVRAIVPAGYMLAPQQDGRFIEIVRCSGHNGQTIFFDQDTGQIVDADTVQKNKHPANPQSDVGPCVFAAMAAMAAHETAPAISAPLRYASVETTRNRATTPGRGLAAPPPWSTGPPQLA